MTEKQNRYSLNEKLCLWKRTCNIYNYSLFAVMIKQISNKIFNYFIEKWIKWFIRFWGFLFHENYSINQATNKSKISVMENKRLSTIASLTKLIKCCEVFFNGCRACVLILKNLFAFNPNLYSHFLCMLLLVTLAMCWGISVQKEGGWLPFLKISKKNRTRTESEIILCISFCAPCSSPHCVLINISSKIFGNSFCP